MTNICVKLARFLREITVEPVLFCYMLIIFMESTAVQSLFVIKVCLKEFDPRNSSECDFESELAKNKSVLAEASSWNKYYSGCMTFFTLIGSFYVASWSDRFSRKIPMLIPLLGTLMASVVNITLSMFIKSDISYYLISAVLSGISFGSVGVIAATFGFLSDVVTKEERTKRIVILEAMIFTGGTFGFYIGGAILKNTMIMDFFNSYAKLFTVELVVDLVIIMYVLFRIPYKSSCVDDGDDDVPLLEDRTFSFGELFSLVHVKDALSTIFRRREGKRRKRILLLLLSLAFMYIGHAVQFTVALLFVKSPPLNWDVEEYSNYSAYQFAVEGIALILGVPLAFYVLHLPDLIIAIVGVLSRTGGLALFGFSTTTAMIYSSGALYVFSEFPLPAVKSVLSKLVDEDEKGRIFTFSTLIQNFCYFVASLVLPTVFSASLEFFPGLCFEVLAILQVCALFIFCYLYCTPDEIITVFERIEKEDGSTEEIKTNVPVFRELELPH